MNRPKRTRKAPTSTIIKNLAHAIGAVASFLLLAAPVTPATAGFLGTCGRDLPPPAPGFPIGNVGCDCGDRVVTDTKLSAFDPITTKICDDIPADPDGGKAALTVAAGVTLDLGGLLIQGTGDAAGSTGVFLHDGAQVNNGRIIGFRIGVSSIGGTVMEKLTVAGNGIGIFVLELTGGCTISENTVFLNGDEGIAGFCDNGRVEKNTAFLNGSVGIRVLGNRNRLIENEAFSNRGHGILVTGRLNRLEDNRADRNGIENVDSLLRQFDRPRLRVDGIRVEGSANALQENLAFENGRDGISVEGAGNELVKNRVGARGIGNQNNGITVRGPLNIVDKNYVYANEGNGIQVSGGTQEFPNVVVDNRVGDKGGRGNLRNGISVLDDRGDGRDGKTEIDNNVVKANGFHPDGVRGHGILIRGVGGEHGLGSNRSGGSGEEVNAFCAFFMVPLGVGGGPNTNYNLGGNRANNARVVGPTFPAGGTGCR
jgi:parallel beta-helix repeat protein